MKLKRTNKLLALLLAVLMVASLLPVGALAAPMAEQTEPASGESGGDDAYEISGDAKPTLRAATGDSGKKEPSLSPVAVNQSYTVNFYENNEITRVGTMKVTTVNARTGTSTVDARDLFVLSLSSKDYEKIVFGPGETTKYIDGKAISNIYYFTDPAQNPTNIGAVTIQSKTIALNPEDAEFQNLETSFTNKENDITLNDGYTLPNDGKKLLFYIAFGDRSSGYSYCCLLVSIVEKEKQVVTSDEPYTLNFYENNEITRVGTMNVTTVNARTGTSTVDARDLFVLSLSSKDYGKLVFGPGETTKYIDGKAISNIYYFTDPAQNPTNIGAVTIQSKTIALNPEDAEFQNLETSFTNKKNDITLNDGCTLPNDGKKLLFYIAFGDRSSGYSYCCLVVSYVQENGTSQPIDKKALQALIDDLSPANYFTENDRYNGKETSVNGFWADLQPVLVSAQNQVLNNVNATQADVDAEVTALTAAKEKLIPRSQINATVLYEQSSTNWRWFNGQVSDHGTETIDASNTTPASLEAYTDALAAAKAELAKLYYQQGDEIPEGKKAGDPKPYNDSKGAAATNVDKAEKDLTAALAGLDHLIGAANAKMAYASLDKLANKLYNPARLTQADYTGTSWDAFIEARGKALQFLKDYKEPGFKVVYEEGPVDMVGKKESQIYVDAYRAFWDACYERLVPANAGKAAVAVEDVYGLTAKTVDESGLFGGSYVAEIPAGGKTLGTLLTETLGSGFESNLNPHKTDFALGIFLNGVYVFNMDQNSAEGFLDSLGYEDILIKPGDEIVVARMRRPTYKNASGSTVPVPSNELLGDIHYLSISGDTLTDANEESNSPVIEATAGESFTLNAQYMLAMMNGYNGGQMAQSGALVYLSPCYGSAADARPAAVSVNSGAMTDANGNFTLTLYSAEGSSEGWYSLNLIDPGERGGVVCGMNLLVHVTEPADLSAVREELKAQLEAVYTAYTEDFYTPEQYADVTAYYSAALEVLNSKTANSGDMKAACTEAEKQISAIQAANEANLTLNLKNVRFLLRHLPTAADLQAGKLYNVDKPILDLLFAEDGWYTRLTPYQRNQFTAIEGRLLGQLSSRYTETNQGADLPAISPFKLSFEVLDVETNEAVELPIYGSLAIEYLDGFVADKNGVLFAQTRFVSTDYDAESGILELPSESYYYTDYTPGIGTDLGENYVFDHQEYSVDPSYCRSTDGETNLDAYYLYREDVHKTYYVRRSNNTVDPLDTVKEAALAELKAAYNGYTRSDYSAENWSELTKAYQDGVKAINEAATEDDVQTALTAAKNAMAAVQKKAAQSADAIPGWGAGDAFDAGTKVGTVTVTVENNTFPGGVFTGTILNQPDYAIGENDNMMTVILRMLADNGYSWTGTGGNGFGISYLATISKDGKTMGEFSGDPGSGWMGALNEFMVNEGLSQFSVAEGTLGDGDEIKLMFTQNLGVDLGGTWGNSDTTLKSLELSSGTLIPGFASGEAGNTYDFALKISGSSDSIVVTPHATNINYMVKTFLNEKVTDNDNHNSYYKRTEAVPVRPGDVIWVGCGERAWPSMNKYGAEARAYTGTWYALHVISADSGADYVNELIAKLPTEKKITYDNYTDVQKQVAVIKQVKAALSSGEQANVNSLKDVKDKITFYSEIDAVKALLAALPKSSNLSDNEVIAARRQIEAADAAYKAMTDEQKGYITVGDVANYNALVERLAKLVPDTTAETITGSEKKPEKDENEVAPAQVAVAPEVVNGEATAEITAEDVSKAIEEAPDAKALTVTVSTEGADKVQADLPAEAVKAAADAGMGVNVETENGTVKLTAANVKAASGKDLAVSVTENSDGSTTIGVTAGGKAVDTKVKVELPAAKDGQVLVIVAADGKETVVKKSVEADGKVYAEIPAGSTVKAVDAQGGDFGDVKESDWFAGAVEFVTSHGLFQGTGEGFEPNATMNRAMLVTVLFRLEDATAAGSKSFADVDAGAWYADAAAWANENGIVTGTDKGFEPDAPVTREQIATILYRYVKTLGLEIGGSADLTKFDDGGDTADWAKDAMRWAVGAGLFRGDAAGRLNPTGNANRAEVATLVQRLVELIVK